MTPAEGTVPTILLDMDGVILRGRQTPQWVYDRAADRAIETLGLSVTDEQRARLSSFEVEDIERVCSGLGVDTAAFWRRREESATAISTERIERGERTVYDDVDAITALAEDRQLGMVSNNRHATVTFVAEHFGLPVAAVRGRDPSPEGFHRRKPDPHYLTETLARLDSEAGLYVGDRASDVEAAARAGLESAYLRRPHNEEDPLPTGASYELDSLADLERILK